MVVLKANWLIHHTQWLAEESVRGLHLSRLSLLKVALSEYGNWCTGHVESLLWITLLVGPVLRTISIIFVASRSIRHLTIEVA